MQKSRIITVSRTRMGESGVCVGAYDVDLRRNIRLLDANGNNQNISFALDVGDIVLASYSRKQNLTPPHTEDVKLYAYEAYSNEHEVRNIFLESAFVVGGAITNCFSGKLFQPSHGALASRNDDPPNHSVCFWRTDRSLKLNRFGKYVYANGAERVQIKYVGFPDPIDCILPGTVVRLSLSRRWSIEGGEPLCWLQLSGWY